MAYRASQHGSTGETPNLLTLGREVELPVDLILGSPEQPREVTPYVVELRERFRDAHERARVHLHKAAKHQRRNYDLPHQQKQLTPGTTVMLAVEARTVGLSPKLQSRRDGPSIVTECINDVNVRIQKGPRHKQNIVHIDRLKRFGGEYDKSWWEGRLICVNNNPKEVQSPVNASATEEHLQSSGSSDGSGTGTPKQPSCTGSSGSKDTNMQ
ncbi:uncharacterized protein LOC119735089 [Patiria miniata]|uniref:Integrase p58-like C-terminal domain-containing protein n=1 Tax=Patiria miniata TaxID=46514 RepID=A0A914AM92_PATMI|nr:uncharacterized protein LOC119735089 [Patiria miniata]